MAIFEINWTFATLEICHKPQHLVFIINKIVYIDL